MVRIHRLPSNTRGRDYVMGDLHGELHMLNAALARLAFDPTCDRLFSVGDLVDRGTQSRQALSLLDEPYFYPVQGNHEAMLIDSVLYGRNHERWMKGGGEWYRSVDPAELPPLAQRLDTLPHLIVVGEGPQRFHIVHAGLVDVDDQPLSDAAVDAQDAAAALNPRSLLLGRGLARRYKAACGEGIADCDRHHPGLSVTFCGHSPVPVPGLLLSHYFVDGGAGSEIYLPPGEQPRLHVIDVRDALA